jgi:hypothetical protein
MVAHELKVDPRAFLMRVLLLFLCVCSVSYAQTQVAKVTKIKLEDYGWQSLPQKQRGEWRGTSSQLVSIDHRGRVLVGFTVRENYDLATREHPGLSFHVLRFTSEGKVDLSLVLPANNLFTNGFYLGSNDQIFARANDILHWTSEEDATRKEPADWRPLVPCPKNCHISQSPSRRTLIVNTYSKEMWEREYDRGTRTITLLDASSSPPRVVQDCPHSGGIITDKFSYQSSDNIQTDARRWPLCHQEHGTELPLDMRGGIVYALNDEALLLLGTGKELRGVELVTPDGQVKFRKEMPKHDVVTGSGYYLPSEVRSDERGDRFAFTVETWRGGSQLLDISGNRVARRVVVYTDAGQELASIPVSTTYHRDFDFSMSPDGHRLAILDDGVLTIAELQ